MPCINYTILSHTARGWCPGQAGKDNFALPLLSTGCTPLEVSVVDWNIQLQVLIAATILINICRHYNPCFLTHLDIVAWSTSQYFAICCWVHLSTHSFFFIQA